MDSRVSDDSIVPKTLLEKDDFECSISLDGIDDSLASSASIGSRERADNEDGIDNWELKDDGSFELYLSDDCSEYEESGLTFQLYLQPDSPSNAHLPDNQYCHSRDEPIDTVSINKEGDCQSDSQDSEKKSEQKHFVSITGENTKGDSISSKFDNSKVYRVVICQTVATQASSTSPLEEQEANLLTEKSSAVHSENKLKVQLSRQRGVPLTVGRKSKVGTRNNVLKRTKISTNQNVVSSSKVDHAKILHQLVDGKANRLSSFLASNGKPAVIKVFRHTASQTVSPLDILPRTGAENAINMKAAGESESIVGKQDDCLDEKPNPSSLKKSTDSGSQDERLNLDSFIKKPDASFLSSGQCFDSPCARQYLESLNRKRETSFSEQGSDKNSAFNRAVPDSLNKNYDSDSANVQANPDSSNRRLVPGTEGKRLEIDSSNKREDPRPLEKRPDPDSSKKRSDSVSSNNREDPCSLDQKQENGPDLISSKKIEDPCSLDKKENTELADKRPDLHSLYQREDPCSLDKKSDPYLTETSSDLGSSNKKEDLCSLEKKSDPALTEERPDLDSSNQREDLCSLDKKEDPDSTEKRQDLDCSNPTEDLCSLNKKEDPNSTEKRQDLDYSNTSVDLCSLNKIPDPDSPEKGPDLDSLNQREDLHSSDNRPVPDSLDKGPDPDSAEDRPNLDHLNKGEDLHSYDNSPDPGSLDKNLDSDSVEDQPNLDPSERKEYPQLSDNRPVPDSLDKNPDSDSVEDRPNLDPSERKEYPQSSDNRPVTDSLDKKPEPVSVEDRPNLDHLNKGEDLHSYDNSPDPGSLDKNPDSDSVEDRPNLDPSERKEYPQLSDNRPVPDSLDKNPDSDSVEDRQNLDHLNKGEDFHSYDNSPDPGSLDKNSDPDSVEDRPNLDPSERKEYPQLSDNRPVPDSLDKNPDSDSVEDRPNLDPSERKEYPQLSDNRPVPDSLDKKPEPVSVEDRPNLDHLNKGEDLHSYDNSPDPGSLDKNLDSDSVEDRPNLDPSERKEYPQLSDNRPVPDSLDKKPEPVSVEDRPNLDHLNKGEDLHSYDNSPDPGSLDKNSDHDFVEDRQNLHPSERKEYPQLSDNRPVPDSLDKNPDSDSVEDRPNLDPSERKEYPQLSDNRPVPDSLDKNPDSDSVEDRQNLDHLNKGEDFHSYDNSPDPGSLDKNSDPDSVEDRSNLDPSERKEYPQLSDNRPVPDSLDKNPDSDSVEDRPNLDPSERKEYPQLSDNRPVPDSLDKNPDSDSVEDRQNLDHLNKGEDFHSYDNSPDPGSLDKNSDPDSVEDRSNLDPSERKEYPQLSDNRPVPDSLDKNPDSDSVEDRQNLDHLNKGEDFHSYDNSPDPGSLDKNSDPDSSDKRPDLNSSNINEGPYFSDNRPVYGKNLGAGSSKENLGPEYLDKKLDFDSSSKKTDFDSLNKRPDSPEKGLDFDSPNEEHVPDSSEKGANLNSSNNSSDDARDNKLIIKRLGLNSLGKRTDSNPGLGSKRLMNEMQREGKRYTLNKEKVKVPDHVKEKLRRLGQVSNKTKATPKNNKPVLQLINPSYTAGNTVGFINNAPPMNNPYVWYPYVSMMDANAFLPAYGALETEIVIPVMIEPFEMEREKPGVVSMTSIGTNTMPEAEIGITHASTNIANLTTYEVQRKGTSINETAMATSRDNVTDKIFKGQEKKERSSVNASGNPLRSLSNSQRNKADDLAGIALNDNTVSVTLPEIHWCDEGETSTTHRISSSLPEAQTFKECQAVMGGASQTYCSKVGPENCKEISTEQANGLLVRNQNLLSKSTKMQTSDNCGSDQHGLLSAEKPIFPKNAFDGNHIKDSQTSSGNDNILNSSPGSLTGRAGRVPIGFQVISREMLESRYFNEGSTDQITGSVSENQNVLSSHAGIQSRQVCQIDQPCTETSNNQMNSDEESENPTYNEAETVEIVPGTTTNLANTQETQSCKHVDKKESCIVESGNETTLENAQEAEIFMDGKTGKTDAVVPNKEKRFGDVQETQNLVEFQAVASCFLAPGNETTLENVPETLLFKESKLYKYGGAAPDKKAVLGNLQETQSQKNIQTEESCSIAPDNKSIMNKPEIVLAKDDQTEKSGIVIPGKEVILENLQENQSQIESDSQNVLNDLPKSPLLTEVKANEIGTDAPGSKSAPSKLSESQNLKAGRTDRSGKLGYQIISRQMLESQNPKNDANDMKKDDMKTANQNVLSKDLKDPQDKSGELESRQSGELETVQENFFVSQSCKLGPLYKPFAIAPSVPKKKESKKGKKRKRNELPPNVQTFPFLDNPWGFAPVDPTISGIVPENHALLSTDESGNLAFGNQRIFVKVADLQRFHEGLVNLKNRQQLSNQTVLSKVPETQCCTECVTEAGSTKKADVLASGDKKCSGQLPDSQKLRDDAGSRSGRLVPNNRTVSGLLDTQSFNGNSIRNACETVSPDIAVLCELPRTQSSKEIPTVETDVSIPDNCANSIRNNHEPERPNPTDLLRFPTTQSSKEGPTVETKQLVPDNRINSIRNTCEPLLPIQTTLYRSASIQNSKVGPTVETNGLVPSNGMNSLRNNYEPERPIQTVLYTSPDTQSSKECPTVETKGLVPSNGMDSQRNIYQPEHPIQTVLYTSPSTQSSKECPTVETKGLVPSNGKNSLRNNYEPERPIQTVLYKSPSTQNSRESPTVETKGLVPSNGKNSLRNNYEPERPIQTVLYKSPSTQNSRESPTVEKKGLVPSNGKNSLRNNYEPERPIQTVLYKSPSTQNSRESPTVETKGLVPSNGKNSLRNNYEPERPIQTVLYKSPSTQNSRESPTVETKGLVPSNGKNSLRNNYEPERPIQTVLYKSPSTQNSRESPTVEKKGLVPSNGKNSLRNNYEPERPIQTVLYTSPDTQSSKECPTVETKGLVPSNGKNSLRNTCQPVCPGSEVLYKSPSTQKSKEGLTAESNGLVTDDLINSIRNTRELIRPSPTVLYKLPSAQNAKEGPTVENNGLVPGNGLISDKTQKHKDAQLDKNRWLANYIHILPKPVTKSPEPCKDEKSRDEDAAADNQTISKSLASEVAEQLIAPSQETNKKHPIDISLLASGNVDVQGMNFENNGRVLQGQELKDILEKLGSLFKGKGYVTFKSKEKSKTSVNPIADGKAKVSTPLTVPEILRDKDENGITENRTKVTSGDSKLHPSKILLINCKPSKGGDKNKVAHVSHSPDNTTRVVPSRKRTRGVNSSDSGIHKKVAMKSILFNNLIYGCSPLLVSSSASLGANECQQQLPRRGRKRNSKEATKIVNSGNSSKKSSSRISSLVWKNIRYNGELIGRKRTILEPCSTLFSWECSHLFASRKLLHDRHAIANKLQKYEVRMGRIMRHYKKLRASSAPDQRDDTDGEAPSQIYPVKDDAESSGKEHSLRATASEVPTASFRSDVVIVKADASAILRQKASRLSQDFCIKHNIRSGSDGGFSERNLSKKDKDISEEKIKSKIQRAVLETSIVASNPLGLPRLSSIPVCIPSDKASAAVSKVVAQECTSHKQKSYDTKNNCECSRIIDNMDGNVFQHSITKLARSLSKHVKKRKKSQIDGRFCSKCGTVLESPKELTRHMLYHLVDKAVDENFSGKSAKRIKLKHINVKESEQKNDEVFESPSFRRKIPEHEENDSEHGIMDHDRKSNKNESSELDGNTSEHHKKEHEGKDGEYGMKEHERNNQGNHAKEQEVSDKGSLVEHDGKEDVNKQSDGVNSKNRITEVGWNDCKMGIEENEREDSEAQGQNGKGNETDLDNDQSTENSQSKENVIYKAQFWKMQEIPQVGEDGSTIQDAGTNEESAEKNRMVWTPLYFDVPVRPVMWQCMNCRKKFKGMSDLKGHGDNCLAEEKVLKNESFVWKG